MRPQRSTQPRDGRSGACPESGLFPGPRIPNSRPVTESMISPHVNRKYGITWVNTDTQSATQHLRAGRRPQKARRNISKCLATAATVSAGNTDEGRRAPARRAVLVGVAGRVVGNHAQGRLVDAELDKAGHNERNGREGHAGAHPLQLCFGARGRREAAPAGCQSLRPKRSWATALGRTGRMRRPRRRRSG